MRFGWRRRYWLALPLVLWALWHGAFWLLDAVSPVDLAPRSQTQVVVDRHGEPLRHFADDQGVWRYPVRLDQVSPNYLEALVAYEDRWFYQHPGINPLALVRALGQWVQHGRIVSGGSTLTMQVVRVRYPSEGRWSGKVQQLVRALQLERHYSKDEILTYYLSHAPFGGPYEGVEAASRSYFGHSADVLTDAQAALLAGLPQAPSLYRPDRFPDRARQQRDKVLDRLVRYSVLSQSRSDQARLEPVLADRRASPLAAPLLARRLAPMAPPDGLVHTFVQRDLQQDVERLTADLDARLPAGASVAVLVMAHGSGEVLAYTGSQNFLNDQRFGHVDMVQAWRSPGSALKPFIYGMALDQGVIHSESLLMDVPLPFGDYRPVNFLRGFSGPVSARRALVASLNLPAVQMLEQVEPRRFYLNLQQASGGLRLPQDAHPSLALALGGVSTNLEHLVQLFSALGNGGHTLKPRFTPDDSVMRQPLLSDGSSWIVRQMLHTPEHPRLAIKTGTSSGYRDTWALAVTEYHTLGVWVGQPDNTAMVGHHGQTTAVPLLRAVAARLPRGTTRWHDRPANVEQVNICWPSGQRMQENDPNCDQAFQAWTLNGQTPATLMHSLAFEHRRTAPWLTVTIAEDTGLRASLGCAASTEPRRIAIWPDPLQTWLPLDWRTEQRLPKADPRCPIAETLVAQSRVRIQGLTDGAQLRPHATTAEAPRLSVQAVGGQPDWYWFINGELQEHRGQRLSLAMPEPGRYQLSVLDQSGQSDQLWFTVEGF